ncbi:BET2 [Brettanomyces bruxellensis]|uniref:Geranylgeranyl transferase type-2 subunit beta n=1 Tax=Dekkera bruxellensis TaxID=5007 RepID=A0A3F2Y5R3_DEKBR|nr:BET2 [Brettanomyces bruxellensis]
MNEHNDDELLLVEKHTNYIKDLFRKPVYLEHWMADHLKMNALYWGICALFLMHQEDAFKKEDVVSFIIKCYDNKYGGFGSAPRHEAHILSTLSALQVLKLYDSLDALSKEQKDKTISFIKSLQLSDGSFEGDRFGEVDTRFVYTAIQSLAILEELDKSIVDPAVDFILKCQNFDGCFGMVPGAESHAAQAFTCLGTLAICNSLNKIKNPEALEWWLSDRQTASGGLNGRPEKLPDVCYSWWVLSCLSILKKLDYIDAESLVKFILRAQNSETGGIADRPGNECDVYHTFFGMAGLSLMKKGDLLLIDPIYGLPTNVTKTIKKYPY